MTNTLNKIMHNGTEYDFPGGISNSTDGTTSTVSNIWVGTDTEYGLITPVEGQVSIVYKDSGGGGWQPGVNTVAYYPLDSTNQLNDLSGNSYTLSNVGSAITFGTNQGVSCASFDGDRDHYLSASISTIPTGNSARTISFWCYTNKTAVDTKADLMLWYGTSGSSKRLWCELADSSSAGANAGKYQVATWGADVASSQTLLWQQWANVIITYDQSSIKIYVNNQKVADTAVTNLNTGNTTLYIGGGSDWATEYYRCWYGYMSNVIIENVAWTAQEISDYYNQTKGDYGIS